MPAYNGLTRTLELGQNSWSPKKPCAQVPDRVHGWDADHHPVAARADAEEGVRLVYRALGLSAPKVVWCRGPIELAQSWTAMVGGDVGANCKSKFGDLIGHDWLLRLRRAQSNAGLMRTLFRGTRRRSLSSAVQAAVLYEMESVRPSFLSWLSRRRGADATQGVRRPTFLQAGYGPLDLELLELAARVQTDGGEVLHGFQLIAKNVGWLVPHQRVCWLSLPPDMLNADAVGRLHCGTGPALRYSDGWTFHAWKGTRIPAWITTQPQKLTLPWIDAQIDPDVRHAMIDIFTPRRFIAAGGADCVAADACGVLWKRTWTHRNVVIDAWAAVQPYSGAGQAWPVPADIASPREAQAWVERSTSLGHSSFEPIAHSISADHATAAGEAER